MEAVGYRGAADHLADRAAHPADRDHGRGAGCAERVEWGRRSPRLRPAHDGRPDHQRADRPRPRQRLRGRAPESGRRRVELAARRRRRAERAVARSRLADEPAGARPARVGCARTGPLPGHLLLRVRRPAGAHGLRDVAALTAPVAKNEELELIIDSLAYGGNGVARLDGFVVFVRRGLPGDTVRARVTKVKRGYAEAVATEVLAPGPDRVEAPCAHFPACGGCRFQDLGYSTQAAAKETQVGDALLRIGGLADPPLEPIVQADSAFFYRNKLEYSFTQTPEGPALGFHKAGRWDEVLEVERCWLTDDLGNAIRGAVRDWVREEGLEAYSQADGTGYLRQLVVRQGRTPGQALVQLVTAPGERFETGYLVDVLRRFPEVRSIHWSVNDTPSEVTNLPTRLLWGDEWIEEELCGLRLRVRPNAFLQTNTAMAERLYALAREAARLSGEETVWDLYCGIGTIALSLAHDALTVWGIEVSEESVACALENAELNGVTNAAFFAGNVGEVTQELLERSGAPEVVVVDPPRAGLAGKALRRLGEIGAPRLVYVSCNPTTLAGDVKALRADYGYELLRVTPADMFPHTPHVECVPLPQRLSAPA